MLLLGFFLLPMFLVTGRELTINDYIVTIEGSTLINVKPTGKPSIELDLSGLNLTMIGPDAFDNASNLTKLNLANNYLSELSSTWLKALVNLQDLSVANNRIHEMSRNFFGLDALTTVDFSNNEYLMSFWAMGDFGRGRCDFIVKGTRIWSLSYANFIYHNPQPTSKQLIPVLLDMNKKCHDWGSYINVEADTTENVADSKIKCPKLLDRSSVTFDTANTPNTDARFEVCIENGTLQRLSDWPSGYDDAKKCRVIDPDRKTKLVLSRMGIEDFAKGWYRARSTTIYSIDLGFNNITELSSSLLNDLPESVKHVNLSGNKIKRLDAGIIENGFLMYLDLSENGLHEIQSNALDKTNLSGLVLSRNNFTDTRFVEKLPSSLTELYLNGNNISQVSDNSFSKLNNLFILDLSLNKITQLGRQSLRGLSSLQRLFLAETGLQNIETGAFQNLGELRELQLGWNNMTEVKGNVFSDLRELIFLYLDGNNIKKVTNDTFKGLPDTLRVLRLGFNRIESLEIGSFVKVPKYELVLYYNAISKIERGAINIPSLRTLLLHYNKLSEIKEEIFDFPNLHELYLDNNLIGKIEKGAFRKLGKVNSLSIMGNPIKTLQKGSLFGTNLRSTIVTDWTDLELIEGGVFFDE